MKRLVGAGSGASSQRYERWQRENRDLARMRQQTDPLKIFELMLETQRLYKTRRLSAQQLLTDVYRQLGEFQPEEGSHFYNIYTDPYTEPEQKYVEMYSYIKKMRSQDITTIRDRIYTLVYRPLLDSMIGNIYGAGLACNMCAPLPRKSVYF